MLFILIIAIFILTQIIAYFGDWQSKEEYGKYDKVVGRKKNETYNYINEEW